MMIATTPAKIGRRMKKCDRRMSSLLAPWGDQEGKADEGCD
jgi:hypothetical protein